MEKAGERGERVHAKGETVQTTNENFCLVQQTFGEYAGHQIHRAAFKFHFLCHVAALNADFFFLKGKKIWSSLNA